MEDGTYRLGVCQFKPKLFDSAYNHDRIARLAQEARRKGAAVVVFPECCTSGYTTGHEQRRLVEFAEPISGGLRRGSVSVLCELARDMGLYIFCGFPEYDDGRIYNSTGLFFPDDREPHVFRKCHLWQGESDVFSPGEPGDVVHGPVGFVSAMICYDLEFPETARCVAVGGADVIAVCTANMEPWCEYQNVYVRARAMENCVYVALANCVGDIGDAAAVGASTIVDPSGEVLCKASAGDDEVMVASIDVAKCVVAREATGYWDRRRPKSYGAVSGMGKAVYGRSSEGGDLGSGEMVEGRSTDAVGRPR